MKERPILFSGAMVRAILSWNKTQTRRVVKVPLEECHVKTACSYNALIRACPYGVPGDRLWVKETFRHICDKEGNQVIQYRSDGAALYVWASDGGEGEFEKVHGTAVSMYDKDTNPPAWKPSIFMPRWASRTALEVVSVRVERLQEISEADAIAEGVTTSMPFLWRADEWQNRTPNISRYAGLWDSINGDKYPWSANPFVWVVEFKRI